MTGCSCRHRCFCSSSAPTSDWAAQFKALADIGYSDAVNLETHWKDGSGLESSSRSSWKGMKEDLQKANVTF